MKGNYKVVASCFLYLEESPVKVVAVCAGSGSSVLQGTEADLYLTGRTALDLFLPFSCASLPYLGLFSFKLKKQHILGQHLTYRWI